VKICGITTAEAAEAAIDAGADALGFVFAQSPRQLSPTLATALAGNLPGHVEKVAVFRRPQHEEITAVLQGFDADTVQADRDSLLGFDDKPVLPVVRNGDIAGLEGHRVLFDSRRSGVGERADWSVAAHVARRSQLLLAGGLSANNVADAIFSVRPFGVDVSSGVESSRGVKDVGLITDFVNECRRIEREMVAT